VIFFRKQKKKETKENKTKKMKKNLSLKKKGGSLYCEEKNYYSWNIFGRLYCLIENFIRSLSEGEKKITELTKGFA
jgi:hypothetical protein